MARPLHKLSARTVETKRAPGVYGDGGGLYLQIGPSGAKAWLFRFMLHGKARTMGLGALHTISLPDAREKALACRKVLNAGADPIEARKADQAKAQLDAAKALTFGECAGAYIEANKTGWKNDKHADQWKNTLDTYAAPIIGQYPVQAVDTTALVRILEQEVRDSKGKASGSFWNTKPETANRVRGRIEAVLDWATARGFRVGENPARWRGHLDKLLPRRSKVKRVEHHAALPYCDMGSFVGRLREQQGVAARALEFMICTAARTGEVIGAQWPEFDLQAKVWTVPASRMKAQREHRVPLSDRAVQIIEDMQKAKRGDYVFPGARAGAPLSNAAMLALLQRRMERADLTVHGFRSTFRTWAAERTNFPRELAEAALAHVLSDKTEAAYQRGDQFEKRRKMMQAWAAFLEVENGATVTSIKKAA
jgi:integrase